MFPSASISIPCGSINPSIVFTTSTSGIVDNVTVSEIASTAQIISPSFDTAISAAFGMTLSPSIGPIKPS